MNEKYLTYRGKLRAIQAVGPALAFITQHAEKLPTSLYRLDPDKSELHEVALPCGASALLVHDSDAWIAGDDGKLHRVTLTAKSPAAKTLTAELPQVATALAALSESRIAALCGDQVVIVDRDKGKPLQTLQLSEAGSSLASDPSGQWLVVGGKKGHVSVFECEDKTDFQISETAKLHEAAVTALLFELEELRFLSAGADQKLLLTHARGKLEPEDRGRGASHQQLVTSMLHVPGERFVTTSTDRSCKTWALVGATRPATLSDGVPKVVDSTLIEIHDRPHLVVAGEDNTIRLFLLDAGGKFGAATHVFHDAYARATHLLRSRDVADRGQALHDLAAVDDARSIEIIAKHLKSETDPPLRQVAVGMLTKSQHPRAASLLEPLLKHDDPQVRMQAFEGLRAFADATDLNPIELALATNQTNIGIAAVLALEPQAKKDDRARQMLVRTLEAKKPEVSRAAMRSLEAVFPKNSPEPTLIAAAASSPRVRRLALIRCYQRKLLKHSRVQAALRRGGEDEQAAVRETAYLVALLANDKLATAVRQRDTSLHRRLHQLESFDFDAVDAPADASDKTPKPATTTDNASSSKAPAKLKATKVNLKPADLEPLLTAISSRATDTCLSGACALASLEDARAFGTLLQLSREEDAKVRVQVCAALQALGDGRALQRLETLINDDAAEVRDAAFTALASLRTDAPLAAADSGLSSHFADVRSRGLQTLVSWLRKSKTRADKLQGQALLLRGLNDEDAKLRGEAFKAALNLQIAGKGVATLRFVLSSSHASVRREVLTEAMGQDKQDWADELLHDLLHDPHQGIRHDAFEYLVGKSKGRDVAPMRAALQSPYADLRLVATQRLVKLHTKAAQQALVAAIDDQDKTIRSTAIKAIIDADAVAVLQQAMESPHIDVRLQAAAARAVFRDPSSQAPLLAAATAEPPEQEADKELWRQHAVTALEGLAQLASPDVIAPLMPLTDSEDPSIRQRAAHALAHCIRAEHTDLVSPLLQHDDASVKYTMAYGLARCRQEIAKPLIFSHAAREALDETAILVAADAYDQATENRLAEFLDSETAWIGNAALLSLLMRDWRNHDGTPRRILLALSARSPRIRLWAARALETFGDAEAYGEFLVRLINDRGDEPPWTISDDDVSRLADVLSFGSPGAIFNLSFLADPKQDGWDLLWRTTQTVLADDFDAATKARQAAVAKLPKITSTRDELRQLAFGTYVGLVREQGGYHGRRARPRFGTSVIAVRQQAIRRLVQLAENDKAMLSAARPVLVQSLSDPIQDVRQLAFDSLPALGMDEAARAEAGLESGYNDLAIAGLKLLAEAAGEQGRKVLEEVVLQRDDSLVLAVARLLNERIGPVEASHSLLQSPNEQARSWILQALESACDKDPAAKAVVREAVESRFEDVRLQAACTLAAVKDEQAFDAIGKLLNEFDDPQRQQQLVNALVDLGDERAGGLILDRLENDPRKTANTSALLVGLGRLRDPSVAERLLTLCEEKLWKKTGLRTVETISGYDQPIFDPNDDLPDRAWMEPQFPRHDDVLAALLQKLHDLDMLKDWLHLIDAARWSLTSAVDPVLAAVSITPHAPLRHRVTEAIGWRVKHRDGPDAALETLLEHRDPTTKFLAAEGLARAGRDDGLSVLLSAVELISDLALRQRAVAALGELSDPRAWDVLLRIASDDVHALQQTAAEAIGHLGTSDRADEVFQLLKRLANGGGTVEYGAIVGLRWLNIPAGWDLIRQCVADSSRQFSTAVEQLGYNDDPATRDLLLRLLSSKEFDPLVLQAARRLFGEESLEPDYAALRSGYDPIVDEYVFGCVRRVCESGQPEPMFALLASDNEDVRTAIGTNLMGREPLPVEAAVQSLNSPHGAVVDVAAHVLGHSAKKSDGKPIPEACQQWLQRWNDCRQATRQSGDRRQRLELQQATASLTRLVWAAGRCGVAKDQLVEWIGSHQDDHCFRPVRLAALEALFEFKLSKTDLAAVAAQTTDGDHRIRQRAAELLARSDASQAAEVLPQALSDRLTFQRLASVEGVPTEQVYATAVTSTHYQPVVLPQLIAADAVDLLVETAQQAELHDSARLGAIEGLAEIANDGAADALVAVGANEANSEDIRKAAWRGLRRAKRRQASRKQANQPS
ncbi:HEAT repeat domain-containing protein [Roseimaritima ulvae]|uniref:HEAT repeat protein n=1 Tax=Roseimaritima ulvae TaxID=980254 RepID=A0A5B9R2K5_9BACT|nr:HEAT repeat domain-containing protein [Roseimaritima ulvae]QEG40491.1 HEAT repeat protein [Roseimaritima ulvae]